MGDSGWSGVLVYIIFGRAPLLHNSSTSSPCVKHKLWSRSYAWLIVVFIFYFDWQTIRYVLQINNKTPNLYSEKNMLLLLTMMTMMTFAIWFVQFCALIIHCQFCHGQVYTSMGFKHKTGAGDRFFRRLSCFWCWVCQTLEKEDITSLSICQMIVSIDFTFQFILVVSTCLWPHDHHELQEKK